jgi:general stress protein YciG
MMSSNPTTTDSPTPAKKKRGFATMDPNQVRELARRGGVAAHRAGTAHEFSAEEARAAGRKGGLAAHSGEKKASEPPPAPSEPAPSNPPV